MSKQSNVVPRPTLRRLAMYLTHMQQLREKGVRWVLSQEMAEALCLSSSTVRQDLTHLDFSGTSRRGYDTEQLAQVLHKELGADQITHMAVVGAGNLGRALVLHGELEKHGLIVVGLFDSDERSVGKKVAGLTVEPVKKLPAVIRNRHITVGIMAVPGSSAQQVANTLVAAGVRGLLNLAPARVCVPKHIALVEASIIPSLQELVHLMRATDR
ncbi:MAG: redox-sensing transcriptional repressor Rex [Deltaproteobacteria bacterium]|nr:redox-sensing transcriptional repressor Rex [Deltaproteobacteria bacterium]